MSNRTSNQRGNVILGAAVTLAMAQCAFGQYQVGGNGHSQDASNQIGGGGQNTPSSTGGGISANDIILHNVTSGRGIAARAASDPRAFSGPLGSSPTDVFNRQANAPVSVGGGIQSFTQPHQYYADSRFAPPPAGSVPLGFNGGYINNTPTTPSSLTGINVQSDAGSLSARTQTADTLTLDRATRTGDTSALQNQLLNQTGTLNVSPVWGPQISAQAAIASRNNLGGLPELGARPSADDLNRYLQMRQEVLDTAQPLQDNVNVNASATNNPTGSNSPLNKPLGPAFGAPVNVPIANQFDNTVTGNQLSSTGTISPNAGKPAPLIPPAEDQSDLLKTLNTRLKESGEVGKALSERKPTQVAPPKSAAPAPADNAIPGPVAPAAGAGKPESVSSLATGIKASGLRSLLSSAEDLVRGGKYDLAIKKYDEAQIVASNNPLPVLGRAQAELAGGYYAKAESDLRSVFRATPSLVMMQFDLSKLIARDRIAFVRKDLHDLAAADPKAERPWFVLAYLDYNTGDSAATDADLTEAEQRDGADWAIRMWRKHWAPTKSGEPGTPNNTRGEAPQPSTTPKVPAQSAPNK